MKRALQSIASTLISGLSNIIVQMVASSALGVSAFAEFTVVAATIIFGVGLGRAVVGQVDMIRGDARSHRGSADAALVVGGFAVLCGVPVMLVAVTMDSTTLGLLGVGISISSLFIVQDALRFRAFRTRRPGAALTSDALVLLISVGGIVAVPEALRGALALSLIWAGATMFGLLAGCGMLGYLPRSPVRGLRWVTRNRDLIAPGAGEYLLQAAVPYALNFAVLAVGGASALAGYRLVQLIFAALGNFAAGLNAATLPGLVDSRDPRLAQRRTRLEVLVLSCASGLLFSVVLAIPEAYGTTLFGESWAEMTPFLLVGALHGWINALAVPNYALLRLLGRALFSFWVRVGSVLATILAAVVAAQLGDAVGIAWAIALPALGAYVVRAWTSGREVRSFIRLNKPLGLPGAGQGP